MDNSQTLQSKPQSDPGHGGANGEPIERAATGAHETVDKIAGATHQAADAISKKGAELHELQDEWLVTIRGYIHEHPVKSVAIAVAGGYVLGRLLSGR